MALITPADSDLDLAAAQYTGTVVGLVGAKVRPAQEAARLGPVGGGVVGGGRCTSKRSI